MLYDYREIDDSIMNRNRKSAEIIIEHWRMVEGVILQILDAHSALTNEYATLVEINRNYLCFQDTKLQLYADKMLDLIRNSAALSDEQMRRCNLIFEKCSARIGYDYFRYYVLKAPVLRPDKLADFIEQKHKVICCASLGKTARDCSGLIAFADIVISECWNDPAPPSGCFLGIPVVLPQYERLCKDDVIIIYATKDGVIESIKSKCGEASVFTYGDLFDYVRYKVQNQM
jgi:hypothetical protein